MNDIDYEPTAADIMTRELVTVEHNLSVLQAAERLVDAGVSNAPVVEHDFTRQILRGLISEKDLMNCYATGAIYQRPGLKVSAIMRKHPACIEPQTPLFTLASVFLQSNHRHLPVVESQVLLGIVSRRDVLRAMVGHFRLWALGDRAQRRIPDIAGLLEAESIVE